VRNIRIDGKVPPAQRQGLVETFQARPRARMP
jgi:SNF2 family DNA or RNA helicase